MGRYGRFWVNPEVPAFAGGDAEDGEVLLVLRVLTSAFFPRRPIRFSESHLAIAPTHSGRHEIAWFSSFGCLFTSSTVALALL